jgi:hypothetical protein
VAPSHDVISCVDGADSPHLLVTLLARGDLLPWAKHLFVTAMSWWLAQGDPPSAPGRLAKPLEAPLAGPFEPTAPGLWERPQPGCAPCPAGAPVAQEGPRTGREGRACDFGPGARIAPYTGC